MIKIKLENEETIDLQIKNAVKAMRTCYDSTHLSDGGQKDKELLKSAVRMRHHTPLEFITLTFSVENLTRAILQELARHRTQVLNVQSTRYTLKKMKDDINENLSKYFYIDLPYYEEYLSMIIEFIDERKLWDLPNDKLKFYFPESLYCKLALNVNLRNFFNFYNLRSSGKAHFLIQELANEMYNKLPEFLKELVIINEKINS